MNLDEAWSLLGRDARRVLATIGGLPRDQRVAAAKKILEKARRMAAISSAPHHPDRGGDPAKFNQFWDALRVIEKSTAEFESAMIEYQRKIDEGPQSGIFIQMKK